MDNKKNDKRNTVKQIQSNVRTLMELPYKNTAMVIQILVSLEDIDKQDNKVSNTTKQESK